VNVETVVTLAKYAGRTGRGVRIAVVDSGIHPAHPHVGGTSAGIAVDEEGRTGPGAGDRLGHGTAVAAAIREKAPDAALIPVRVFDTTLTTTAAALAAAIRWAAAEGAALINLSLGTTTPDHAVVLESAVRDAAGHGALVISAAPQGDTTWLPGALAGVVAVEADWESARDVFRVRSEGDDRLVIRASGLPRPMPGVPTNRNFRGTSFAVANATGLLALAIEGRTVRSVGELAGCLQL
jgi:subtilisin family serine protease